MEKRTYPSGAAKAKAAKQRAADERRRRAGADPLEADEGAGEFAALGGPDLSHPDLGLEYGRRCLLVALRQAATDPGLERRDRWRLVQELSKALGMTHPRARIESKFKQLQATRNRPAEAPTPTHPSGIERPPTARVYPKGDQ